MNCIIRYVKGALVGGPDKFDNFKNDRENYRTNEVALDYNACYQGMMAALLHKELIDHGHVKNEETFSAIPEEALLSTASSDLPPDPFYYDTASITGLNLILLIISLILLH